MLKLDDNDMAVKIAWIEFERKHPKWKWPEWLLKCIIISGYKNKNKWVIKISLLPKTKLKPNQYWEYRRDIPVLVEVDPATGEKSIIICNGPAKDVEVIFKVEVDVNNGTAIVIQDTEIELLDGEKYEKNKK